MICKKCGNVIDDNAKFCPECGEKVESENTTSGTYDASGSYSSNDNTTYERKTAGTTIDDALEKAANEIENAGKYNLFCVLSIIFTVLSLVTGSFSLLFLIAGLVLAIIGRKQALENNERGRILGTIAMIVCIIFIVLIILTIILGFGFFGSAMYWASYM